MPIEFKPREAIYYKTETGFEPAYCFLKNMKDPIGQAKMRTRISRAERGNFGQEGSGYRHIAGDIWELKINYGPGYRVYFYLDKRNLIVLLVAGSKVSQGTDIMQALIYLNDYNIQKELK